MNPEGFLVLLCQKPRLVREPEKATAFNGSFEDGPLDLARMTGPEGFVPTSQPDD